jgi:hypothetical protein
MDVISVQSMIEIAVKKYIARLSAAERSTHREIAIHFSLEEMLHAHMPHEDRAGRVLGVAAATTMFLPRLALRAAPTAFCARRTFVS